MPFVDLSTAVAREALASLGVHVTEGELSIEARGERWLVRLPERRIAWFAASELGRQTMATEHRVLRLLAERCSFGAPRVLHVSAGGELEVRSMVPGDAEPWRTFAEVCASAEISRTIGSAVGAMLAEQHTRICAADVASWLPHRPAWPKPAAWVHDRLPRVVDDAVLIGRAARIMDAYARVAVADADRALVHNDLGLHNLGIDATTHQVHGVFDYEEAAWADRHHDFRYLVFDRDRYALFDAAVATYKSLTGLTIERERVLLYNAAQAGAYDEAGLPCRFQHRRQFLELADDGAHRTTISSCDRAARGTPGPKRAGVRP